MSVRLESGRIHLEGECRVEDAEPLALLLQQHPQALVDVSLCRLAHSAVLQALLAFRAQVVGTTGVTFLDDRAFAALRAAAAPDSDNVELAANGRL